MDKNKKELTVNKRNDLIQQFQTDLTRQEWDIFDFIVANIKAPFLYDSKGNKVDVKDSQGNTISSYDTEFNEIKFNFKDFSRIMYNKPNPSGKDYETFKKAIKRLKKRESKTIVIKEGDKAGYETELNIIDKDYRKESEQEIILKLDADLAPYLLQIRNGYEYDEDGNILSKPTPFTSYKLNYKVMLKLKYAKRLYEILKSYENLKDGIFPSDINGIKIEDFKKLLSIPEGYKYSNIKTRILDEAIGQINDNTDIYVVYTEVKEGKKVVALRFKIKKQSDSKTIRAIEAKKEEQIVFRNSLEEKFMNFFEIKNIGQYRDVCARMEENLFILYKTSDEEDINFLKDRYMQNILDNVSNTNNEIKNKWKYLRKILENDFKEARRSLKTKKDVDEESNDLSLKDVFELCKSLGRIDIKEFKALDSEDQEKIEKAFNLYFDQDRMTDEEIMDTYIVVNGIEVEDIVGKERALRIEKLRARRLEELIENLKNE